MPLTTIRTPDEVRAEFADCGMSITSWALAHGYSPNLVSEVLAGRKKCVRGKCHDIAVKLGLKKGKIMLPKDLHFTKRAA